MPVAAFTLTELLVVIAITAILLGLLFIPLINGFQLTNRIRNQAAAQDAARLGMERLVRELSQAAVVLDNSAAPVVIPLGNRTIPVGGAPTDRPPILFAKIDFVPADQETPPTGSVIDPTTGLPVGGGGIRLPLAPSSRVVRYFLGLANNTKPYENVYEFPREDAGFNPLLLWRAEFRADDPNLFRQGPFADGESSVSPGRFDDPNFFYNEMAAPNGQTYAQNWRRVSSPVMDGARLDLLAWRRDGTRELIADAPIATLVRFEPGTVASDVATPGFLSSANAEAPGAVPTLYTSQYTNWVAPYTVTFFRSSSRVRDAGGNSDRNFGSLAIRLVNQVQADLSTQLRVELAGGQGILETSPDSIYCLVSPTTGKIFVKTPRLTYAIDPERGRIETGFPPLAGDSSGVPYFANIAGAIGPMQPYPVMNRGELVPLVYRVGTRDPQAGSNGTPANQGRLSMDLLDPQATLYYRDTPTLSGPAYSSPLIVFGALYTPSVVAGGGVMVAPGTERVVAPDLTNTSSSLISLVPYFRAAAASDISTIKKTAAIQGGLYGPITGERNYEIDQTSRPNAAWLTFDIAGGPGLPAHAFDNPEMELRVSYLWQNNYARRNDVGAPDNGWPLDALDRSARDAQADIKPEADVVKIDYATRSLINVSLGARVYDTNSRFPVTIQLADRVKVNNVTR
jgi:type II secretory pathway pseudopilin PulG